MRLPTVSQIRRLLKKWPKCRLTRHTYCVEENDIIQCCPIGLVCYDKIGGKNLVEVVNMSSQLINQSESLKGFVGGFDCDKSDFYGLKKNKKFQRSYRCGAEIRRAFHA